MKTEYISGKDIKKKWLLLDARDMVLGRLATAAATYLKGKHKPTYTPNADDGDYLVIINADKVKLTGNKLTDKIYYKHTGYIGHLNEVNYETLMQKKPEFVIKKAIRGMLPKGRLGRAQLNNLKVYRGSEHKHEAQKPELITL